MWSVGADQGARGEKIMYQRKIFDKTAEFRFILHVHVHSGNESLLQSQADRSVDGLRERS